MAELSESTRSIDSMASSSEEPSFGSSEPLEIPTAPLIDIFDDPPRQSPPPVFTEGNAKGRTIVDQFSDLLSPLVRFGNRFEQVYVRPTICLSLNALGVSPPTAQYLETPTTLAFLFTTSFFLVATLVSTSKEVLRLSAVLLAYSLDRGFSSSLRLLRLTGESILIFLSLSLIAVIGKALLGFSMLNHPTERPSAEQLSAHNTPAREQTERRRMDDSSAEMRELVDHLTRWKESIRGTVGSLKARIAGQMFWLEVVAVVFAYVALRAVLMLSVPQYKI